MKPVFELTWRQIFYGALVWAAILFLLLLALAGCSNSARFTPMVAPGCLLLCVTIVHEDYKATTEKEDVR